jgi:uncharacterized protein (TIGR02246 family)
MRREDVEAWLAAYFAAWRSNDPDAVAALFAPDATYHYGPFREPAHGRERIVANWIADGPPASLEHRAEVLAVQGDTGVAHWWVRQVARAADQPLEMDGILVLRFDPDGRCVEHREWYASRSHP